MAETLKDIDAGLVTTGSPVDGGCVYAAFGTPKAYATDATTKVSMLADFKSLGDLDEDGFTASKSVTKNKFKGWHGTNVLAKNSGEDHTFKLVFIETARPEVAALRYGKANVEVGEDGSVAHIKAIAGTDETVSLIIDELEDTGYLRRTMVYKATIDTFDDVQHKRGGLVTYGFTFTALDDGTHPLYEIWRAKPASA